MTSRLEMLRLAAERGKRIIGKDAESVYEYAPLDLMEVTREHYARVVEPIFEVVKNEYKIPNRNIIRSLGSVLSGVLYVSEYFLEENPQQNVITGTAIWGVQVLNRDAAKYRSLEMSINTSGTAIFKGQYYYCNRQEEVDKLYVDVASLLEKGGDFHSVNTAGPAHSRDGDHVA